MRHYEVALKSLSGGLLIFDADGFRLEDGNAVFYRIDENGDIEDSWVAASGEWTYIGLVSDEQLAELNKRKEAK